MVYFSFVSAQKLIFYLYVLKSCQHRLNHKLFFQEGCLSFKGDYVLTERWTDIVVTDDNHANQLFFSFEKNALECVCVQHEIDHLNGITMFDRAVDKELFNV